MAHTGRTKAFGPTALTTTGAAVLPASAALIYYLCQLHAVNITGAAVGYSVSINTGSVTGATAVAFNKSVPANSVDQIFFSPGLRIVNTDIYASAAANTSITLTGVYESEPV